MLKDENGTKIGFTLERKGVVYRFKKVVKIADANKKSSLLIQPWISLLNKHVIRFGDLKAYYALQYLGTGGQAKVI